MPAIASERRPALGRLLPRLTLLSTDFTVHTGPLAYVCNEGSGTLSVIDVATDAVLHELFVGAKPRHVAISPDGRRAYIGDRSGRLVVVDLAMRRVAGEIPLGGSPDSLSPSTDGRLIATVIGATHQVVFVDTRTLARSFAVRVRTRQPEHAAFTPCGRWLLVSAAEGEAVDVIDVQRRRLCASIPVHARPGGLAFSADGQRAYVAGEMSGEIHVVDLATFQVRHTLMAGPRCSGLCAHPDDRRVFVADGDASVLVLDMGRMAVLARIPVGRQPQHMALTPDGGKLYVICGHAGLVSVIDTDLLQCVAEVPAGAFPCNVVVR